MRVDVIEATPNPDELSCRAARGDYSSEWVAKERSFDEVMEPVNGNSLESKKYNLIRKCVKREHWGIFEHPSISLAVEGISRSCMAQITRHRIASFDVQSMRYVEMDDPDFYFPPSLFMDTVSREGESLDQQDAKYLEAQLERHYEECMKMYNMAVDMGMPKEDARMFLPLGTTVNLTVSGNARTFMHILSLRTASDAQGEIRELSDQILDILEEWAPVMFGVFRDELPMRVSP